MKPCRARSPRVIEHPLLSPLSQQVWKNYIESDSRVKSDTNQLQYNLKSNTCPDCPCPKFYCTAHLAWCCCVGFCRTQQVLVFGLSQSAVGFYIIILVPPSPALYMGLMREGRWMSHF